PPRSTARAWRTRSTPPSPRPPRRGASAWRRCGRPCCGATSTTGRSRCWTASRASGCALRRPRAAKSRAHDETGRDAPARVPEEGRAMTTVVVLQNGNLWGEWDRLRALLTTAGQMALNLLLAVVVFLIGWAIARRAGLVAL